MVIHLDLGDQKCILKSKHSTASRSKAIGEICELLSSQIDEHLPEAQSKIWHRVPRREPNCWMQQTEGWFEAYVLERGRQALVEEVDGNPVGTTRTFPRGGASLEDGGRGAAKDNERV